jgi:limonene-1,2-epoxide hydrolase
MAHAPACDRCPVRAGCAHGRSGGAEADPAVGSAGVSGRQSPFAGSDRQGRGRLVAALRTGPLRVASLAEAMGWPGEDDRAERVARGVVADGLAVRVGDRLALPGRDAAPGGEHARGAKPGDMSETPNALQVVNDFIAAVGRKDQDAAMALVAEDCYYDNVPIGDMRGKEKMLEFLGPMFRSKGRLEFEVHRQACTDNVVFNERTDYMTIKGKEIALPLTGVFEVNDGLITFWRDYFDNGMFMKALKGE